MAYSVKRINPLDLQPRKAIGVTLPFSGKAVFNSSYTTKDAIRSNLINLLLTGRRERVFNPNLGSNLRRFLFENITENSIINLKQEISDLIQGYFPTLVVEELTLSGLPDDNLVVFYMKYNITNTNIEDEIVINVES